MQGPESGIDVRTPDGHEEVTVVHEQATELHSGLDRSQRLRKEGKTFPDDPRI
jgi:hypothetical protein